MFLLAYWLSLSVFLAAGDGVTIGDDIQLSVNGEVQEGVPLELAGELNKLSKYLKKLYYGRSDKDKRWKKRLQCAACEIVARDLGAALGRMQSWTTVTPSVAHYEEEFEAVCSSVGKYSLVAVHAHDDHRLLTRGDPLRFVETASSSVATLKGQYIDVALQETCDEMTEENYDALVGIWPATPLLVVEKMCVAELSVCDEAELVNSVIAFEPDRLKELTDVAMERFMVALSDNTTIKRKEFSCMSCDVAFQHILDSIGVEGDYYKDRRFFPSVADLNATCGAVEDWELWGLAYNYWNDEVEARFLRKTDASNGTIKVAVQQMIPALLHGLCKAVARQEHPNLNGMAPPAKNCHHTHWCDDTQWTGDTVTEVHYKFDIYKQRDGSYEWEPEKVLLDDLITGNAGRARHSEL